jgi:hypothetical protein
MKTLKKLLTAPLDLAAAILLAPLALASSMLEGPEHVEFRSWYCDRCKGSWLRLWA